MREVATRFKALSAEEHDALAAKVAASQSGGGAAAANEGAACGVDDDEADDVEEADEAEAEPRPARSAYLFFIDECYDAVRASLPAGRPLSEVSRACGARWRTLGAAERAPFEALHVTDFLRVKRAEMELRVCALDIERTTPLDALRFLRDARCDMTPRNAHRKLPAAMRQRRRRWSLEAQNAAAIGVPAQPLSAGTLEGELMSVDVNRLTVREARNLLQRLRERRKTDGEEEEEEEERSD
jgi:hypothetical protein